MNNERSEWRAEGQMVYRLVRVGSTSMVNEFSVLVQRGQSTSDENCKFLAKRIAALLNAGEIPIYG